MDLKPDETLLFRNTMRITEGRLADFKGAVREAVEFAEQRGPQLMVQMVGRVPDHGEAPYCGLRPVPVKVSIHGVDVS